MKLSRLLHTRVEVLSEIPDSIDFIDELPDYKVEMYVHKKMKTNLENSLEHLKKSYEALKELSQWNEEQIYDCLKELIQQLGVKNGQILWPIRTAVSGKQFTPGGAIELLDLLGKEESLRRIKTGIEKLMAKADT
jgi:glutamyl-tRNA synthetase